MAGVNLRDRLEARLSDAGIDEGERAGRIALISEAIDGFLASTGRPPQWGGLGPGRIEVFGKHTDYAGGHSLVAAVPQGFAFVAAPRNDERIVARDVRWSSVMEISPDDTRTFHGWANYVAVVARRLNRNSRPTWAPIWPRATRARRRLQFVVAGGRVALALTAARALRRNGSTRAIAGRRAIWCGRERPGVSHSGRYEWRRHARRADRRHLNCRPGRVVRSVTCRAGRCRGARAPGVSS
jgi:hypothetical protein